MEGVVTKEAGLGSRANTPLPAAKNKDVLWLITCISHLEIQQPHFFNQYFVWIAFSKIILLTF